MQVYLRVYFFSLGLNISCKGLFSPFFLSCIGDCFYEKFTNFQKQNQSLSLSSVTFRYLKVLKKSVNIKATGHFQNIGKSIFLKEYFSHFKSPFFYTFWRIFCLKSWLFHNIIKKINFFFIIVFFVSG